MKVLMINTYDDYGGAAIACKRTMEALNEITSIEVKLLCLIKKSDNERVKSVGRNFSLYLEKADFLLYEKSKQSRFAFSTAKFGTDISRHSWVLEADVLHLHWINLGFLSIKNIGKILELDKPVFWTFHDMWPFTGGCHQSNLCHEYQNKCGNCSAFLRNPNPTDLSYKILQEKKKWDTSKLHIIGISEWMNVRISKSSLFKKSKFCTVPNPINSTIFKRKDKSSLRKKWGLEEEKTYLLFTAAYIDNYFKGFDLFLEIIEKLKFYDEDIVVLFAGEFRSYDLANLPMSYIHFGKVTDENKMAEIYNLADLFISTSPNESFSYTALEAAFCGNFIIGFDTGEIGSIIAKTGYGVLVNSIEDFLAAIKTFLEKKKAFIEPNLNKLSFYSYETVAKELYSLYHSKLALL
ncbi:glycosyltransferase [Jiulongibacter sediminis]|uniref:glycosyltransferase n=1 Tax=Jiulongibacter sediminis TaxID=1605367 RepID=UPI0026F2FC86|nr:glycosyltransferase [Jiulongibacter sediminis]